jgi:ATP-dependent Clp protease ATP-binding subunit ClpA
MPSSKDRQRVELPTGLYDRLKLMAESEERPLTNLLQDLVRLGLTNYQPLWMPQRFMSRFTEGAQRALALAGNEARALQHSAVGTEHLLLGLLREGDGIAAQVLHQLWIDHDQVHKAVVYLTTNFGQDQPGPAAPAPAGEPAPAASTTPAAESPIDQPAVPEEVVFTQRVRTVLTLAVDEAQRLHQEYVGTEHLLLALARESDGIAMKLLGERGLSADALRDAVRRTLDEPVADEVADRPKAGPPTGDTLRRAQPFASAPDHLSVPLAPDARRALGRALAAALADGREELTADDLRAALSSD